MRKFLAILKREYLQRLRSKMFLFATVLGPLLMSLFGIVPLLIFNISAGGPVRVAVVDQTGKIYPRLTANLSGDHREESASAEPAFDANSVTTNANQSITQAGKARPSKFELQEVKIANRSIDEVRNELNQRLREKQLDGYVVLPPNLLQEGSAQYFGSNTGDVFTTERLEDALTAAVREQRLAEANIDVELVSELSTPVALKAIKMGDSGEEVDAGEGFVLVFASGFIIYLTILMYGQVVLGAVIEEKETRIAEILFSSVRPFTLMVGKLIGVSLLGLTQLAVWATAFLLFTTLAAKGLPFNIPNVPLTVYVYFALFFLLGYFIYSTIYALVGSMVTTAQEGGQLALPIVFLLAIGFYLAFPVIQRPDSNLAFWVSMVPFFSPITMLVRIVTQTPPFWQILLSLVIGFGTALLLIWLAGRIYRVGMLMYGKKATIPEVLRWVRQA
jgi:ABC-2 type transport system permease protein